MVEGSFSGLKRASFLGHGINNGPRFEWFDQSHDVFH